MNIFERLTGAWAKRQHRDGLQYRQRSAIGLTDPPASVLNAARFWLLDITGIARLSRRIYRDRYFLTVDSQFGRFLRLPYPQEHKRKLRIRVLRCVSIIAAFSAWEEVSWAMIEVGFTVAIALAATAGFVTIGRVLPGASVGVITVGVVVVAVSIYLARSISFMVPRIWPRSALVMVVLAAIALSLLPVMTGHAGNSGYVWAARMPLNERMLIFDTAWVPWVQIALWPAAVLWIGFALALSIAAAFYIRATARRLERFPEEEIIQAIVALLGDLAENKEGVPDKRVDWRGCLRRVKIIDRLEWIARRFENEYIARYVGHDKTTDVLLQRTARGCAARIRAQKRMVAFPSHNTYSDLKEFLWTTLRAAASHAWGSIVDDELPEVIPSRRQQLVSAMRGLAAIIGPAIFGLAFFKYYPAGAGSDGIRVNVLITMLAWSALSFLAMLNPKQFELQVAAAKSIGSIIAQKKSSS